MRVRGTGITEGGRAKEDPMSYMPDSDEEQPEPQAEQTGVDDATTELLRSRLGIGVPRRMTPIERLPGQIAEAERRLARLKRLEDLLERNPELREALDIIFDGGLS